MEQRILQYRKQIDEWLTEMEQNVQTLSQHGEYATQAVQRQTHTQKTDTEKTNIKKTDTEEQTMQEMVQDKLKEHLVQVGFFQHERLIHLIVTVTFALLEMLAIVLSVISDSLFTLLLPIVILILLIPYIRHYYILRMKCKKCMCSTTGCGDCNRQQPGAKSKNQRDNRNNTVKINKRKR